MSPTGRINRSYAYARAYLNVNTAQTCDQLAEINALNNYYHSYPFFFKLLELSSISYDMKQNYINGFWEKFKLQSSLKQFMFLLLRNRVMNLLPHILKHLYIEYKKRNNLLDATITTSHPLNDEEIKAILHAIQDSLKTTIIPHFKVDRKLLAGIRIESDEYYWENSIAKTLQMLALKLSN